MHAAKRWLGPDGVYLSSELGPYWQNPLLALVAGVAIAVGIYVVFHLVLGLSLARGPWGF